MKNIGNLSTKKYEGFLSKIIVFNFSERDLEGRAMFERIIKIGNFSTKKYEGFLSKIIVFNFSARDLAREGYVLKNYEEYMES